MLGIISKFNFNVLVKSISVEPYMKVCFDFTLFLFLIVFVYCIIAGTFYNQIYQVVIISIAKSLNVINNYLYHIMDTIFGIHFFLQDAKCNKIHFLAVFIINILDKISVAFIIYSCNYR